MKSAPVRCVAVDDEPLALDIITAYVARLPAITLIQTFDDALAASEFLRTTEIDLLFVDINMPDISGIDLVRSLAIKPLIIFTTAYKNFAYEGFQLEAVDYLLKPIAFEPFVKAVNKAIDFLELKNKPKSEPEESLYVHSEYRLLKINLRDIEYIESLEDYIKIHVTGARPILTLLSMKKVLEKLPDAKFKRIHRSFIVPMAQVTAIQNRKAILLSGKELPISDSYTGFIQDWHQTIL
ncbi:LytR/AlgR family response regulator transcription factor [Adhaeribacter pallidiroseus]|uniref:Putative chemotaxis response regulator protein-glutamate methylesterase n=1 Tax=Adhaeribacter pallidiroseus TaxID=2072847 RepID=A0A369QNA5_9BACT|nr:LytTR family DNA-binding domain-containing protein [Adhaeribacter pallidiroseus]RDC64339.1 putative chemotaxis response regulator protein-glutamate methylesterase [Adhaeribacter pallidiroseus]